MNVWMQHERFLSYLVIRAFTRTKTVRFYLRVIKVCRVQRWRFSKVLLPRLFVSNTNERARHSPESHLRISFDITARHKHNNIIRLQTFRLVYIELASSFFYCYLWSFFFLAVRLFIWTKFYYYFLGDVLQLGRLWLCKFEVLEMLTLNKSIDVSEVDPTQKQSNFLLKLTRKLQCTFMKRFIKKSFRLSFYDFA